MITLYSYPSIDAGIYGFIANIYFYDIDTPLKQFVCARPNLVRHCMAIHETVMPGSQIPGCRDSH